jgi:hypothetical protein
MAVTGWDELLVGDIFGAIMALYESYYGDWFITILFLAFKIIIWFTTSSGASGNMVLGFIISMIFLGLFYSTLNPLVAGSVVAIAVLELGAILYSLIFKK